MKKANLSARNVAWFMLAFGGFSLLFTKPAQALQITGASLSNLEIPYEQSGTPTGTTVQFTLDGPADVEIQVADNSSGDVVSVLNQSFPGSGSYSLYWSALWDLGGDPGRRNGFYSFTITASSSNVTTQTSINNLAHITSIDIHNVLATPGFDGNASTTFPVRIDFALARAGNVFINIYKLNGSLARTLVNNKLYDGEVIKSTNTVMWDGLGDDNRTVPIGLYTVAVAAIDPTNNDHAYTRTRDITIQSLAGSALDSQKVFEDNVYVSPNPVRNGQGIFSVQPVRDNAVLTLKIYTMTGDLVFDKNITGLVPFTWLVVNQSGQKLGRGLYYYVVREEDSVGTLQAVKKMVVIP